MIRIREIDHVVLRITDVARALAFYRDALGCAVVRRQDDIGLIQLRAGRSLIDLVPIAGKLGAAGGMAPGAEGRNVDHFCVRVEPFDDVAIRAHLARCGIAAGPTEMRSAPKAWGRRCTSPTPMAIPSSSKDRRVDVCALLGL